MDIQRHSQILAAVNDLFKSAEGIPEWVTYGDVSHAEHGEYIQWINHQLTSLDDALFLLKEKNAYKSVFCILRSVFEGYWTFALALNGTIFFKYYTAQPDNDISKIHKKWTDTIADMHSKGGALNVIEVMPLEGKEMRVAFRGLDGGNGDPAIIPYYYFILKEYDPTTAYLGSEKLTETSMLDQRILTEQYKTQRSINKKYVDLFKGIFPHLKINGLADDRTIQKIKVHYNFLSIWVHPTLKSVELIDKTNVGSYRPYTEINKKEDFQLTRLGLLYIGNLLTLYLKLLLDFYDRQKAEGKILDVKKDSVLESIKNFEAVSDYFWFIYNKPHYFYKYNHSVQSAWADRTTANSQASFKTPDELTDEEITYYQDPYATIQNVFQGMSNPILGSYVPPTY